MKLTLLQKSFWEISREDKYLHFDIKQIGLYRRHNLPYFFFILSTKLVSSFWKSSLYPVCGYKHQLDCFSPLEFPSASLSLSTPFQFQFICSGMIEKNVERQSAYAQRGRPVRCLSTKTLEIVAKAGPSWLPFFFVEKNQNLMISLGQIPSIQ